MLNFYHNLKNTNQIDKYSKVHDNSQYWQSCEEMSNSYPTVGNVN